MNFNVSITVRVVLAVLLALITLGLMSCGTSQIVTTLGIAIDAAEVAIPIIATTSGVPPTVIQAASSWLSGANTALGEVSTILASGKTPAEEAAAITAALGSYAQVNLPPGTPQAIVSALTAVANEVVKLLTQSTSAKSVAIQRHADQKPVHLSTQDLQKLKNYRIKLAANARRLDTMKINGR